MNNELLALLAKMGCTVTEENGKIIIEQGNKEDMFVPKDGDIMAINSGAFILKMINVKTKYPVAYGGINSIGEFIVSEGYRWTREKFRPATDEEKSLLFAKMKEAGKQWNAEKKCIEDLPYQPKDKELVWCWDDNYTSTRHLKFYDAKNGCAFSLYGQREGYHYHNYAPFEGEWPVWAREAVNRLEY